MNQENQPVVNQLPTEPVTQKPNNFLVILLSILLFISCIIAGFFAYQTQKLVNELRVTRDELKQTPTSTPIPANLVGTQEEEVKIFVSDYLISRGYDSDYLIVDDPILLGTHKDKYSVGWKLSNDSYAHGGTYLLAGKLNGKWIIPNDGDINYCNWIKTANLDEDTQAFMGSSCYFSN